jgi:hypothetical protein
MPVPVGVALQIVVGVGRVCSRRMEIPTGSRVIVVVGQIPAALIVPLSFIDWDGSVLHRTEVSSKAAWR